MALAGQDVPEQPRDITVPIGARFSVVLPGRPTALQIVAALIGPTWAAQQRWVEQAKEQRAPFWCHSPGTLLLNLWFAGRIEFWARETMHLSTALIRLDFVYPERLARQFALDPLLGRLTYLPDGRVFYDLHVRAVVPAEIVPQQHEMPMDDPREEPAGTHLSEALSAQSAPPLAEDGPKPTPKQLRRPASHFFALARELIADGVDPYADDCWSQVKDHVKKRLIPKGQHHYTTTEVRLALRFIVYDVPTWRKRG